jgi:hypothetical protein
MLDDEWSEREWLLSISSHPADKLDIVEWIP